MKIDLPEPDIFEGDYKCGHASENYYSESAVLELLKNAPEKPENHLIPSVAITAIPKQARSH